MVEFFPQNSKEKNQNKLLNYEETKKKNTGTYKSKFNEIVLDE